MVEAVSDTRRVAASGRKYGNAGQKSGQGVFAIRVVDVQRLLGLRYGRRKQAVPRDR